MPGATTNITPREKAAILALQLGIIPDAKTAFIAAHDSAEKDVPRGSLNSYVSKWMNSDKVKQFNEYVNRLLADRDADARQRGREEAEKMREREEETGGSERTQPKPGRAVDYYDPANQRKQINRIIAASGDDPKTQLDAIKAIQQTQRDDRQAAKDAQIQRFYSPVQCRDCIIKANFAKLRRRLQAQEAQPESEDNTI